MAKSQLYIHIGMPKTATSALQWFFTMNRDVLKEKGIAYPAIANMEAHHRLGWSLKAERGLSHWWFDKDIDDYNQEWQELSRRCCLPRNLISTETLWGIDNDGISVIRDLVRSYHAKIIVYLRRQDFFKESLYNEQVKMGIEKGIDRKIGDPNKKFALWERAFGKDYMIVRPFERGQFYGGSIYADFMKSCFSEDLTDDYRLPESEVNPRFHRAVIEYKRLVNHLPLTSQEKCITIRPLQQASAVFYQNGRHSDFVFSPDQRRKVIKECQKFYSHIARDYLGRSNNTLFYDPLPDNNEKWQSYDKLTEADAATINQYFADHSPEVLKVITRGIADAQKAGGKRLKAAVKQLLPGIPSEYFTNHVMCVPASASFDGNIQDESAFDEIYASRMWEMLEFFRPIYERLPARLKKGAVLGVHRIFHLFHHQRKTSRYISGQPKELYLHIGTVKTGTTALQKFFDLNREVLKAKGIIYPQTKNDSHAHHRASWCFVARDGVSKSHWPKDIQRPKQEWKYLLNQITNGTGLISSEHLIRNRIKVIREIRNFTRDFKVKIVVYWRRRDTLEDSWYNQLTKGGDNFSEPDFREGLTSKKYLDMWARVFGRESIIVRPYEKGQLYKRDVLTDFLHHIFGFEIEDGFVLPEEDANMRLHNVVLEYKRLINHLPLSKSDRRKTTDPLRDLSSVLSEQGRKSYPVFSPAQRLELIEKYAAENAAIAREYLGREDGKLFYDPLPDPNADWQPYEELLEEDARFINEYLAEHCPQALERIVVGIARASSSKRAPVKEAALRLLPGIAPEVLYRALEVNFKTPEPDKNVPIFQEELEQMYASRIWKISMLLNRIYNKMPRWFQRPAQECAKWLYHRMKL